jgi:UPF0755 protein
MPLADLLDAAKSALSFHFHRCALEWAAALVIVLSLLCSYTSAFAAPPMFPTGTTIVIGTGASARAVAEQLAAEHVVRSAAIFDALMRITRIGSHIHPGAYRLAAPESAFSVAERLGAGAFGIPPARITFVEGDTVRDMARKVSAAFPEISASDFIAAAGPYEGYLFPDTYLFPPDATAASVVSAARQNFNTKIATVTPAITASGHSVHDIVVMASLIEKEARSPAARRMISGILWNRIKKGMPLQVDAVFGYIFGRDTYSPSFADLGVDSPYNTYTHRGLPPGPIDNPGLDSLGAAAEPTSSSYLYYLTGTDGQMHYATTYAEQLANQRRYLR